MSTAPDTHEAYVLDASVVLAWFTEAKRCPQARLIRQRHALGRCRLILPDLALVETAIVLRARPSFTEVDVRAALSQLEDLQLEIQSLSWELARKAVTLAEAYAIGLTRAVSLAMAESLGCPMLTTDRVLLDKKSKDSSMILDLSELDALESILTMEDKLGDRPWDGCRRE
jgi:predicted nucleic acid-binding protein